jgi:hypothetical protein
VQTPIDKYTVYITQSRDLPTIVAREPGGMKAKIKKKKRKKKKKTFIIFEKGTKEYKKENAAIISLPGNILLHSEQNRKEGKSLNYNIACVMRWFRTKGMLYSTPGIKIWGDCVNTL